jgi:hypothetical protein
MGDKQSLMFIEMNVHFAPVDAVPTVSAIARKLPSAWQDWGRGKNRASPARSALATSTPITSG